MVPDALADLTGGLFSAESLQIATGGGLSGVAPHQRTLIRDYVVAKMRGLVLDGDRVEGSRQLPITDTELPKVLVYTMSEAAEEWNRSPLRVQRTLELVIDVCVSQHLFLDDQADMVGNAIEQLLMQDPSLGGLAVETIIARTDKAKVETTSVDLALLRLTFSVIYQTEHVELVPDNLEQIAARMDISPPDQQIDSEDLVELPVKEGP